MTIPFDPIEPS
jgi:hypothetical protein